MEKSIEDHLVEVPRGVYKNEKTPIFDLLNDDYDSDYFGEPIEMKYEVD